MKYVNNVTTLVYYDVPQVLIGQSKEKNYYLAVLYNITDNGVLQYTATQFDEYNYRNYLFKDTDIRTIILSNDTYLATYDGQSLCLQDEVITPSEDMLPEPNCTISELQGRLKLNDLNT